MGEAKVGVSASQRADAENLENEIAAIRAEIDQTIAELDRRRRDAMDVRLQLSKHAGPLIVVALGGGALLAGAGLLVFMRSRNARKPATRVKKMRRAARRFIDHPERVARGEQPLHMKLLTASLTALAGATAKKLVERALVVPTREEALLLASPPGVAEPHHAAFRPVGHFEA